MPQEEGVPPPGRNQKGENLKALAGVYEKTLGTFPEAAREGKIRLIESAFTTLKSRLSGTEGFVLNAKREAVLKLKLARHFQELFEERYRDTLGEQELRSGSQLTTPERRALRERTAGELGALDLNILYDALVEVPGFIDESKGKLSTLLALHEKNNILAAAELERELAEKAADSDLNPFVHLFETASGHYHLVKLRNLPHLKEESALMKHCVGRSDSYWNRMKRGEIEIFSFRKVPKLNQTTQKLENGNPVITIEYNVKTKTIEQIKKAAGAYLSPSDPFFADVIDALRQLRESTNDAGATREWKKISPSELENIKVKNDHVLTERGEIHYRDFNPDADTLVLKHGRFNLNEKTKKEDVVKMLRIVTGIDYTPDSIALGEKDLKKKLKANEHVRTYVGALFKGAFEVIPLNVERIYANFGVGEIRQREMRGIGGKDAETLINGDVETDFKGLKELEKDGGGTSGYALPMMRHQDFETRRAKSPETAHFVELSVADMGFPNGATTKDLYAKAQALGLTFCRPDDAIYWRLDAQYAAEEEPGSYLIFGMEQIAGSDGRPRVFCVNRNDDGQRWLCDDFARPDGEWYPEDRFVFRKSELKT